MKDFAIPLAIAVLGLAATLLGAVVGARAAKFGAEKSAEALRRQVQDQSTVEHGHWLRHQRLSAYENFLEAWDECLRITQAPAAAHTADSTELDDLKRAAGRMAERARRIAILGPEDVTHSAESLTETMEEDVEISTRLLTVLQAADQDIEGLPIPTDAMAEAQEEYERRTQEVTDLMASYSEQGRDLRELDGHPLLQAALDGIDQFQQAHGAVQDAFLVNLDRMAAAVDDASALMEEVRQNREARELSRERFTSAARASLSAPPQTSPTDPRTETTDVLSPRAPRRRHPRT